jgi:DNA invertase Pin-like site-specific DNA recombinase
MAKVGYGRVSSTGQSLDVQLEKLNSYGCEEVFQEKRSGRTRDERQSLAECLRFVRKGDSLIVTKLDRLARSLLDLQQIANELRQKGVELVVLDQNIDTSTSSGRAMFAEFENDLRKERQADGIAKALDNGVKFGAKSKVTQAQVEEIKLKRSEGVLIKDLMTEYGVSKASIYRILGENK